MYQSAAFHSDPSKLQTNDAGVLAECSQILTTKTRDRTNTFASQHPLPYDPVSFVAHRS